VPIAVGIKSGLPINQRLEAEYDQHLVLLGEQEKADTALTNPESNFRATFIK
jgi:hypothetical protein